MKKNVIYYLFFAAIICILCLVFLLKYRTVYFESFDNAPDMYVISLRHEDRMRNIENQQLKLDSKLEIIDAVKGDQLNLDELINDNKISRNYKEGAEYRKREIGCYMSHLKTYNTIKTKNHTGYSILFEDDFAIDNEQFNTFVLGKIAELSSAKVDFDMLFLGNTNKNHGKQLMDHIYYVNEDDPLIGCYAILINNKNIDKIMKATSFIDSPIDHKIGDLSRNGQLNILVLYPTIVSHLEETKSTIRDMSIETFINR